MSQRKSSFAPVVDEHTRVLILGSLPGERSLAEQRYYAHPRNLFWQLVGEVIGQDLAAMGYEDRLSRLLRSGIGLWDVVGSGRRQGSLDSAIREVKANPLGELVEGLPQLRAVAFNGQKAATLGQRLLAERAPELLRLPSSSPAYAAMRREEKQKHWLALRDFLETPRAEGH
ncbi:DNA-deoxyinosine glycosylase [Aurantiacibacter sp. MUD11]|uniref:DNA-deoxyinosine glycosylase n=1 Tax=Aurantiacibacter sp. MUD11 TaxID=3003265 RepID=UPI0022AAB73A|nr:DNA-deoxyinosine glycosylase [Aurantiacibacter sp. MUD11]WAT18994.1 DNA-deoxyinosine glycosylase [Aurantiacibacter sp. MUD11]